MQERLEKNAQIYNSAGQKVYSFDLYKPIPENLQRGTFFILSEHVGRQPVMSLADLQTKKIAMIVNGQFSVDPDEWFRNYM